MRKMIKIGDLFGKLTIIDKSDIHKGKQFWNCKCECGNLTKAWTSQLNRGVKKSCGCLRSETSRKSIAKPILGRTLPYGEAARNKLYFTYRFDAKGKDVDFCLTRDQFSILTKGNCAYCGKEPNHAYTYKNMNGPYTANGIDRVNSSLGYTIENTVSCCKTCNLMKNTLSVEEFFTHIELIYKHKRR